MRRNKAFAFGFLFFSISIIFFVHFVLVGATITADRFSYVPSIGLSFIVACFFERFSAGVFFRTTDKALVFVSGILIIAMLGLVAHRRCRVWTDSITLWDDVIAKEPNSTYAAFLGNEHIGCALMQIGQPEAAMTHFLKAMEYNPRDARAHYNLGNALMQVGRPADAVAEYRKALRIDSGYAFAHYNLAVALRQLGLTDEAIAEYRKALSIDPSDALAHNNLADALLQRGLTDEAVAEYRKALDLDHQYFDAYCNLGIALMRERRAADAVACFQNALNVAPADLTTLNHLCNFFLKIGKTDLAVGAAGKALALAKSTGRENLAREIAGNMEEMKKGEATQSKN